MASFTINGGTTFPEGTSVSVYPRTAWGVEGVTGAPSGSATAGPATITGGTATFTGLADKTEYVAYAASPDRYKRFSTPPVATGAFDQTAADLRYEEQMPALVAPSDPRMVTSVSTATTNRLSGTRVICPRTGTMTDLYVFIGTASGNGRGTVYDTAGSTRTKLFDSGSILITANWMKLGNLSLAVTAGSQFDFAFQPDNPTASIGRFVTAAAAGVVDLPTGFWSVTGSPRPLLTWFNDPGSFTAPATLTEASLATQASPIYLMARVI